MSQDERRKDQRYTITIPLQVTIEVNGLPTRQEHLHDISDGGISFSTEDAERYQIDETIMISINSGQDSSPPFLSCRGTIIWINHDPFSLNKGTIGIQFEEIIKAVNFIA